MCTFATAVVTLESSGASSVPTGWQNRQGMLRRTDVACDSAAGRPL